MIERMPSGEPAEIFLQRKERELMNAYLDVKRAIKRILTRDRASGGPLFNLHRANGIDVEDLASMDAIAHRAGD